MPRVQRLRPNRRLVFRLVREIRDYERRRPERERQRVIAEAKAERPFPFLVLAAAFGDHGVRPLPLGAAHHNPSVQVIEIAAGGHPIGGPVLAVEAGKRYQLRCVIANLGNVPALMGIAEFFVATPVRLEAAAKGAPPPPAFGYAGFTAPQGKALTVACKKLWEPTEDEAGSTGVLVQVYDPSGDFLSARFDAANDRHVGRYDLGGQPDFVGKWAGGYLGPIGKEPEIRVEVKPQGQGLGADIVFDVFGVAHHATGKLQGQQAALTSGELPTFEGTTSTWTLTFVDPSTMQLHHELKFEDGSKDTGEASLHRVL